MTKRRSIPSLFLILVLALASFISLRADEGLWLFNNLPSKLLLKKYNFNVTPEWIEHIRQSSISFGGASGSFVSPAGLVLTNHHVGQGAIQQLSTKEHDMMKTGFYARTRAEELKVPNMTLRVLQGIDDVTDRVTAAEQPGMSPVDAAAARSKVIADIEKENNEKTSLQGQVVNLYSGGMYHLYKYRTFNDVRLVFAPEYAAAFFGGDQDNFTYPRYDLDICIFRIYENDKPFSSTDYLRWSASGAKEGELVLVSGHPGSTGRLLSYAQLELLRDVIYPAGINTAKRRQAYMHEYGKKGEEQARIALRYLFGIENGLKATTGYQSGLLDPALMTKKRNEEQALRAAVKASPELEKEFGSAWDELAEAEKNYASFYKAYNFFERGNGFYTTYFNMARTIVRMAMEKDKPSDKRMERAILSPSPIYDDFELLKLTDSLTQLNDELGGMQEVKWIMNCRTPEETAKALITGTRLGDIEFRKKLVSGGGDAVYNSDDPMIKLALLVDPISRGLRARYEKEVSAVEIRNGARIARAMFKLKGTSFPPDATGSLRLSFGVATGYRENGRKVPYYTTFAGLFDKAKKAGNKDPYELPKSYLSHENAVNKNVPIDFVATADSIGGNSGSPVVNRKGEFVGLLFDGNIQSLPTRFVYEDTISRSVMVDSRGIVEALLKIYDAKPLVDEMTGKK